MIKVIHDDTITFFEQEYLLLNNSLGKFRSGKKKKKQTGSVRSIFRATGVCCIFVFSKKKKKRKLFKLDEKNVFSKSFSIRSSTFIRIQREDRSDSSLIKKPDKRKYV